MIEKVILVRPRGFCAGVERAIKIVEDCLQIFGKPVYVKHEIVHNKHVVDSLTKKGAITVNTVEEIPQNATAVFSAHGSPPQDFEKARQKNIRLIDATCPLVSKVHLEVHRYANQGYTILYIGHKGHVEADGVCAELPGKLHLIETIKDIEEIRMNKEEEDDKEKNQNNDNKKGVYLTQTTLSVDETKEIIAALKKRFPNIKEPPSEDICYATTNRQAAIKELAKNVDVIFVIGSKNSSNSRRLAETAQKTGKTAFLIDDVNGIKKEMFKDAKIIGLSAGASVPEYLVQQAVEYFVNLGAKKEELNVLNEVMTFKEPLELIKIKREQKGI